MNFPSMDIHVQERCANLRLHWSVSHISHSRLLHVREIRYFCDDAYTITLFSGVFQSVEPV